MPDFNTIVFDLGGVLIDWNPEYVYKELIPDETQRNWFLGNVCTPDWNEEQDGGRTLQDGTNLLLQRYPEHHDHIRAFYDRWQDMLGGPIAGTVDILRQLRNSKKYALYALTNWSAETFPVALDKFEFLHWFDGRLVSGEEKMRKPFPDIYHRLVTRFSIDPDRSIYIDDNLRNLAPAKSMGFETIHFQSAHQLQQQLDRLLR